MRSRSFATVFGLVVLVAGLAFFYIGVTQGAEERALARHGVVVQGTVTDKRIDHVTRRRRGGGTLEERLYVVRYRFATQQGAGVDGERPVSEALWRALRQNSGIAVRYLQSDPFNNRPDAEPAREMDVFLLAGILLASASFVFLVVQIRRNRRAANRSL
jgi:hypothetical protein